MGNDIDPRVFGHARLDARVGADRRHVVGRTGHWIHADRFSAVQRAGCVHLRAQASGSANRSAGDGAAGIDRTHDTFDDDRGHA